MNAYTFSFNLINKQGLVDYLKKIYQQSWLLITNILKKDLFYTV